ncbi:MAG TPA: hypothetical protein V6D09_05220 [Leptolyngbyaceae cyanobacterium]
MTNCWQFADNLRHHFSAYCIELSTISKTSQSRAQFCQLIATFLAQKWQKCGNKLAQENVELSVAQK